MMKIFFWRHNKKFHSYSMIDEPCISNGFYNDAVAIVLAPDKKTAIDILVSRDEGWRADDLQQIPVQEYSLSEAKVIFSELRGN